MRAACLVLVGADLVYATSYAATRLALGDVPPALLGLLRLVVGGAIVVTVARVMEPSAPALAPADTRRMVWMGVCRFAAPFAFGDWGLAASTCSSCCPVWPTRRTRCSAARCCGGTARWW